MSEYSLQPVDIETAKLSGDCAGQITVDLGESPEAWRGAAIMAHFIKSTVMAAVDADLDLTGELVIDEFRLCQLLTVGFLEQLPMWPADISGEPLVSEGLPDQMRAHFQEIHDD